MLDWILSTPWPILFLAFLWTIPCECHCSTCLICQDRFDRLDNSNIDFGSPCGWTEESGDWAIVTERLRSTRYEELGVLVHARAMSGSPAPSERVDLAGTVMFGNVGDEFVVYFDHLTEINRHEVRFRLISVAEAEVKLFRAGAQQGDTFIVPAAAGIDIAWQVCVMGATRIGVSFGIGDQADPSLRTFFETVSFFGSGNWGLGTREVASLIEIDSVVANRSDLDGCRCSAPCTPDCPAEMRLDMLDGIVPAGCDGDCGFLDGGSFYLPFTGSGYESDCDPIQISGCGWSQTFTMDGCPEGGINRSVELAVFAKLDIPEIGFPGELIATYRETHFHVPSGQNVPHTITFVDTPFTVATQCKNLTNHEVPIMSECAPYTDYDHFECVEFDGSLDTTMRVAVTSIV